jgi:hypothetical protein
MTIPMESTGVYCILVYEFLEERGSEVLSTPMKGRKS